MDDEISAEEVERLLESDEQPRIIDIRSPGAFARGHIPGSENVPFGELPDRIGEFADADHIVTVCPHGKASVQAARLINSYEGTGDARVESMAGGLDAWSGELMANDETEAADGGETPESPF
ncbi:rhodanese-like domain-containing protein [Haloplanus halobius]|uniref:rhodanese-like domain-containing protein n=1 Tax=Haloplanus halobius TaxID=2934938 RepID=UPI00200F42F6|nr:rhodanese-like domain-containing protein [Haloplanus sp. XH21]